MRSKRGMLLRSWPVLPLLLLPTSHVAGSSEAGFCLLQATSSHDAASPLARGRPIPPREPPLAVHDWPPNKLADVAAATSHYVRCHAAAPIFRFKVVAGAVYGEPGSNSNKAYQPYQQAFLEMLVLSIWAYPAFPDVDLVVDFSDHPQLCTQDIPFLRFSIFNGSLLHGREKAFNLSELLMPAWVTPEYAAQAAPGAAGTAADAADMAYTRGFTMPSPEAWRDLSLSPEQLAAYVRCIDETHPVKRPVAFWRGAATGCSRGWPRATGAAAAAAGRQQQPQPHLLRNKRVQLAMRAFPLPHLFDVGLTGLSQLTPDCMGTIPDPKQRQQQQQHEQQDEESGSQWPDDQEQDQAPQAQSGGLRKAVTSFLCVLCGKQQEGSSSGRARDGAAAAELLHQSAPSAAGGRPAAGAVSATEQVYDTVLQLLHREGVGMEGWADAAVTLSVDGFGPAYRLPQQLLLGSAVLRQSSPYQTWLDCQLQAGKHLAEFAYDLSDFEDQASTLLAGDGPAARPRRPRRLAAAARRLVLKTVNIQAQLDAFVWSVARYKEACPWRVEPPAEDDASWLLLPLNPADVFNSKGVPESVQLQVMQHVPNFEAALRHPAYHQQQQPSCNTGPDVVASKS